jgi:hypothetical protein
MDKKIFEQCLKKLQELSTQIKAHRSDLYYYEQFLDYIQSSGVDLAAAIMWASKKDYSRLDWGGT